MIYQSKHFSPPNAIKCILKHLQHTFQLIIYHTSRFTHQNAHCSKYITTFQKTIRLLAEHNSNWQFAIYQSKVFSPPNAIKYILKHLQHTFQLLIYHTLVLYSLNSSCIYIKSQIFQKTIRLPAEHNSNWQFAIYQSKVFSPPNAIKYILKHLQHTFQLLIYHTSRFNHQNPHCSKYITTFQKTIRLIAEHSLIWHFVIYQSKHFSPHNAIKYILKHLQYTFQLIIYHTSRFTHQNAHCSKYITTFQKTIRLLAEHNSIWHSVIYQSKHFSPPNAIKYILKHLQHTFQLIIYHTSRFTHQNAHCSKYITTFQKTIRLLAEHNSNWQFAIYQSIVFSPPNAIKYILKHLQHTFQLLIYHT